MSWYHNIANKRSNPFTTVITIYEYVLQMTSIAVQWAPSVDFNVHDDSIELGNLG